VEALLELVLEAPVEAPVDVEAAGALDAAVVELDDEHAAVTPSSNTAAAPAAGTDTDRFIPAPSREVCVRLPSYSASGNLAETYGLMVQQACHRCQGIQVMLFSLAESPPQAADIVSGSSLDIGDTTSHPLRNSLLDSYSGVAAPVMDRRLGRRRYRSRKGVVQ
jgi:hypothetical protein